MLGRKGSFQCISLVECKTTLPTDGIRKGDTDIEIRPDGLNISTLFASYLVNHNAMLYDLRGDYEHHCWVLNMKWKNNFFELWIYHFDNIMVRIDGPKKLAVYQEFIDLVQNFLNYNEQFSDIKWRGEMQNKRFAFPTESEEHT